MKIISSLPAKVLVQLNVSPDYTQSPTSSGKYPDKIEYEIPPIVIQSIIDLAENQRELQSKIDKILESRIGKSIVNLETGINSENK